MRRLLLVSPYFVPANTPDMQRVRLSLPYYREFGWEPVILSVRPEYYDRGVEPELWQTLPEGVDVRGVRALPVRFTSKMGVGNLALRALPYLYRRGSELLSSGSFDLVFFSTTQFAAPVLGRAWRARHGVPYVVDLQDPWVSDEPNPEMLSRWPLKYRLARAMHAILEPFAMKGAEGLCAVSGAYIDEVKERHAQLSPVPSAVIPFGADARDFEAARRGSWTVTDEARNRVRGLYAGRGGQDLERAARVCFRALRLGLERDPDQFGRLEFSFLGTDYATGNRVRKTIEPVAEQLGVSDFVLEDTSRLPYLETLRRLQAADFLIILGGEDSRYNPSKLFTYLVAARPLLAILHADSEAANLVEAARPDSLVLFGNGDPGDEAATAALYRRLSCLLEGSWPPAVNDPCMMRRFSARCLTREQCDLFEQVIAGTDQ